MAAIELGISGRKLLGLSSEQASIFASRRPSAMRLRRSLSRARSKPPPRMNSTMRRNSSGSNQTPCDRHESSITPEQPAKLKRFISSAQTAHGR